MPAIPQANQLNPAYFKLCRTYVELPVISSIRANIRNTGFGFHDVLERGTGTESNTYLINLSKLENKIRGINYFQTETDLNLLGFGFGVKDWYVTFNISNHSDVLLAYPKSILLLRDKNLEAPSFVGNSIYMNHLKTEASLWNSIGVSVAKQIGKTLKVGFRLKYLEGMANGTTRKTQVKVTTTSDPPSITAKLRSQIYTSFPVDVTYDSSGRVSKLSVDNAFDNITANYIFNGNRGAAIDAGFVWELDEKTELAVSFTDLGFIRWRKNVNKFITSGNYVFNDSLLTHFQTIPGASDLAEALRDSINRMTSAIQNPYTTLTPVKIFAGISHEVMNNLRAGAMVRIEIYNLHTVASGTISLNYTPFPFISTSLSYTIMNYKINQVGAGIAVGNHLVQFYLTADNIPVRYIKDNNSALFWPYNARMFSLHTGINLLFGCRQKPSRHQLGKYKTKNDCPAYN